MMRLTNRVEPRQQGRLRCHLVGRIRKDNEGKEKGTMASTAYRSAIDLKQGRDRQMKDNVSTLVSKEDEAFQSGAGGASCAVLR